MEKISLGISSCLLGHKVRYDGGHKLDPYLARTLSEHIRWVPLCPEAECGLGVPRPPIRLVMEEEGTRLKVIESGRDLTILMKSFSTLRLKELSKENLCGFVFKARSPSCGPEGIKTKGIGKKGRAPGLFAEAFSGRFPLLPVESEEGMADSGRREGFLCRAFALGRWTHFLASGPRKKDLMHFHAGMKLLVMSHSITHYRELGRLVASQKDYGRRELFERYPLMLMDALRLRATPRKHANVLMHIMGYFKKRLEPGEKQELLGLIDDYRLGRIPLSIPLALLRKYAVRFRETYILKQTYLNPYPGKRDSESLPETGLLA